MLQIPEKLISKTKINNNQYTVGKGETLYSISRKYGLSVPELLEVNKGVVVDSLSIGSVLNLPAKVVEKTSQEKISAIYQSKPLKYEYDYGSSLSGVLAELKVSEDSLRSINPNFDSIVQNGGELLLGFENKHLLFANNKQFKDSIVKDKEVRVLLMLPFDFKKNDTLAGETLFRKSKGLPSIVADFYLGAEVALDSLKKQGINVEVSVIDTEKKVAVVKEKIEILQAFHPDVIIGPLYTDITKYVASKFPETPVFYPIYSKKQKTLTQNNIYKTVPKKKLYEEAILAYIKENRKGERLIIVGKEENIETLKVYKKALAKRNSSGIIIEDDVALLTPTKGYISQEEFLKKAKLEQENWFLITDKDNVLTADIINNAKGIPRDSILETPIKVISFQKSEDAKKVPYASLAKFRYTYATDQVEYIEIAQKLFEQTFVNKNNTFPSDYAKKGFNVTYDAVLRALKGNSKGFLGASHRYQQAFNYQKANGDKTTKNQAVFVNEITKDKKEGLKIIRLR